jgi:hypothetical protein
MRWGTVRRRKLGGGDELTGGLRLRSGQGAGLVARPVAAVEHLDVEPSRVLGLDRGAHQPLRLVGGVVKHLDL